MRCQSILPRGIIEQMCMCVCFHMDACACLCTCVSYLLLYIKEQNLISEKLWTDSTMAAELQNQRRQFHWRLKYRKEDRREKEKEDKETERNKGRRGWDSDGAKDQSRNWKRERQSIACVWAVIIQQASIMELQQRTEYISLWPSLLSLSWTHTHLCARSKESSHPVFYLVWL